jgi:homoserine dehydrogenase
MLTQQVLEKTMNDAIAAIEALDIIQGQVTRIRVEQLN